MLMVGTPLLLIPVKLLTYVCLCLFATNLCISPSPPLPLRLLPQLRRLVKLPELRLEKPEGSLLGATETKVGGVDGRIRMYEVCWG